MTTPASPTLAEATRVFARIGLLSFGGPAAQIAVMHRELVEERPWLTEQQFLNALSFCMLLPGPEATQIATYAGWRLHGVKGGLIAGLLFVVPGALVMLGLAMGYALYGKIPWVEAMFLGIKAAVVVIVIEALLRVARKALKGWAHWIIAALSFVGIFFLTLPFPLIIATAALFGYLTQRSAEDPPPHPKGANPMRTIAIWMTLWWAPVGVLWAAGATFLTQIGVFFAKLAVVTFGGAYAVLAYMTQAAVFDHGWLTTPQMMDGLGLAETTPGPLILVTEFVAFIAGFGEQGIAMGVAAALLALWVTFVPCYLWIFTGAPYIEWIATRPRLRGALSAITAAVVGVVLNLSLWFALHVFFGTVTTIRHGPVTLFTPDLTTLDWRVVGLAVLSAVMILWLHMDLLKVLFLVALGGIALSFI
ncbi:chromate efflux transporter [Profundibacter amoris]|uniref:Chromate efflux transporter n=1 Tax=Profundibacter amoris TaxID=2171755 RepID=A0A347UFN1_9RHOB|nr:chromate efflux transporter [Profundibacter amoris]AXX97659.1 chromate efflux transporter [Profundibacter amoris]